MTLAEAIEAFNNFAGWEQTGPNQWVHKAYGLEADYTDEFWVNVYPVEFWVNVYPVDQYLEGACYWEHGELEEHLEFLYQHFAK
jgi:hypothetical protein